MRIAITILNKKSVVTTYAFGKGMDVSCMAAALVELASEKISEETNKYEYEIRKAICETIMEQPPKAVNKDE
jgi:hypothetical protein